MNRLFCTALSLLTVSIAFCATSGTSGNKSNDIADSLQTSDNSDRYNMFDGWTDEQYNRYKDSLIAALYPPIEMHMADNSTFGKGPRRISPDNNSSHSISNSHVPNSVAINTSNSAVGQIDISSDVTSTGAKTYNVPINVHKGLENFTPQISLSYNSQGGNSTLGFGWTISGISTIVRSGKSLYYDNEIEGVVMDCSDSFTLDGIRLAKTTSSSYGYMTYESESQNIQAKAYYNGDVVTYFEVYYPNGHKATFGFTNNTQNQLYYPITKLSDLHGNTINYTYSYSDYRYNITSITYNGASVVFSYTDSRTDPQLIFEGGIKIYETKLLKSISCKFGSTILGTYDLTYMSTSNTPNKCSLLEQINYTSNGKSFNPLRFYYGEGLIGSYNYSTTNLHEWYTASDPKEIKVLKGKFDYINGSDGLIMLPQKNSYFEDTKRKYFENIYEGTEKIFLYAGLGDEWVYPMPNLVTEEGFIDILCADIEGKQEEYIIKINNTVVNGKDQVKFTVYISNVITGLTKLYTRTYTFDTVINNHVHPKFYYSGDFDGDGKMEIMAISAHQPFNDTNKPSKCYIFDLPNDQIIYNSQIIPYKIDFIGTSSNTPQDVQNNSDKLFVMDYDGDGKSDVCHIDSKGLHVYVFYKQNNKLYSHKEATFYNTTLCKSGLANREILLGDFNGDGKTDFFVSPTYGSGITSRWTMFNSKGDGQFAQSSVTMSIAAESYGYLTQDMNGDGISDLIYYSDSNFKPCLAENNAFNTISTMRAYKKGSIFIPTNINTRNSFTQLICVKDGVATKYAYNRNDQKEVMLTGMVNSLGIVEKNEYRMINNEGASSGLYQNGSGAEFPYINIQEPIAVVSASEKYMNGECVNSDYYNYTNAVYHRQGLGFCGFGKISNLHDGDQIETTYNPYNFGVTTNEKTPQKDISYTYSTNVDYRKVAKVFLTKKVEKDLLRNITATTNYTNDKYGNPTSESTTFSDGITITKDRTYANELRTDYGYNLGFVTNELVTITRNGTSYAERTNIPSHSLRLPDSKVLYKNGNKVKELTYQYDQTGNPTSETIKMFDSSNSQQTLFTYDSYGRVISEKNPLGQTKKYAYNTAGRLEKVTNFDGNITKYNYDDFGREHSVTEADSTGLTTIRRWASANGSLYAIDEISFGKPTVTRYYDASGREVRVSEGRFDFTSKNIDKQYDNRGNLISESLPFVSGTASGSTTYKYDVHNRVTSMTEASGNKITHSYSGNSVTTSSINGSVTRTYDSQNKLISITDQAGTLTYALCADGQPSSVTAPGSVVTYFSYDKYRRKTSIDDPSHGTTTFAYDADGNETSKTNANGESTTSSYDIYGRITSTATSEMSTTYTYDSSNRISSVTSSNGTSKTYSYDGYGRLKSLKETAVDGIWLQKDYSYSNGNISAIKYTSQSGALATEIYKYSNGHLTETSLNGNTTIYKILSVNTFGQPTKLSSVGGITRLYGYDENGRPTSRKAESSSTTYQDFSYVFDDNTANLTSRTDNTRNVTETFGYDNLDRLVSYAGNTAKYDIKGNITEKSDVGTFTYATTSKPYAISGLSPASGVNATPTYDQEINYTSFNRPESISENGYSASFVYNSDYSRVKMAMTHNGANVTTRYYIGGCYEVEKTSDSTTERLYLSDDYYDAPAVYVKVGSNSTIYSLLRDHIGNITHVINQDGSMIQELSYDAWGRLRNPETHQAYTPADEQKPVLGRGYTGHEHLNEFGLINMNARLYDPAVGRFLSPDPRLQIPESSQNFNRYSYALNNPLKCIDPDGEFFLFTAFNAITDLFINCFKYGFNLDKYNFDRTINSFKINMGMYKGNILQVASKWTYGAFNSFVGNLVAESYNTIGRVDHVTYLDGIVALGGATSGSSAVTIGHYTMGPEGYKADWRDNLFVHEYGHYIQSQQWGGLFLPVIGAASLISAATSDSYTHKERWYEMDANRLSAKHFNKRYGSGNPNYVEDSGHFFDIDAFVGRKSESIYRNLRTHDHNNKSYYPIRQVDKKYIK